MDSAILEKAKDRYRIASKALARMKKESSLEGQEDEWFTFLRAWKGIYTALEQAVKGDAKATMWFGQRNSFRRKDELLQYVFQARNDDEHGLTRTTKREPGGISFGRPIDPSKPMRIDNLSISSKGGVININWSGKNENFDPSLKVIPPRLKLMPVKDRDHKTTYSPPTQHLGKPFANAERDPIVVAEAALSYIDELIREAEGF
ncbi:hypothetical protein ACQKH5_04035 [Hyphomonas sp. NPDC076900]|uniref:hypothetical protein n=1 Tax=unclassified Hyphomonas TaxID=2630699 RepID=UPI003CFEE5C2